MYICFLFFQNKEPVEEKADFIACRDKSSITTDDIKEKKRTTDFVALERKVCFIYKYIPTVYSVTFSFSPLKFIGFIYIYIFYFFIQG